MIQKKMNIMNRQEMMTQKKKVKTIVRKVIGRERQKTRVSHVIKKRIGQSCDKDMEITKSYQEVKELMGEIDRGRFLWLFNINYSVDGRKFTLPEHLSSPPVFSRVRVTRSLVLCVCFVDRCLYFFFQPLCCLLRYTDSDFPFGIFKLFLWRLFFMTYSVVMKGVGNNRESR